MSDRRDVQPRRQYSDRRKEDRRQSARHPSEVLVRFLRTGAPSESALQGQLTDVSRTGVRILLGQPLQPAEALLIEARDQEDHCFNLTAQVVWTETVREGTFRVGCELRVELTDRQYSALKQLARESFAEDDLPEGVS